MTPTLNRRQVLEMIANHTVDEEEGIRLLTLTGFNQEYPAAKNQEPADGSTGGKNLSALIQQELTSIAARILGVEQESLDPDGNLYESGFESVTLTQYADHINRAYELEIMPTVFFELEPSSIGALARYLFDNYEKHFSLYYSRRSFPGDPGPAVPPDHREQKKEPPCRRETREKQGPGQVCGPIAIIGMSGRFPGSPDLGIFWKHLEAGDDLISETPPERWDWKLLAGETGPARWGGFIADVEKFDAEFFGISPREARLMDPQHRLFLETVWKTIEDAGYKASDLGGTRTGIFVGVSVTDYSEVIFSQPQEVDPHLATGLSHAVLANRVSYLLNLHGPSEPIDTACSSSLVAIKRAMESIRSGTSEMAIAGGVNVILSPKGFIAFDSAGMLAKDGRCKTFDHRADGYVRSEGVGAVFLKPLSRAEEEGDHIYGIIIGASENHGGRAHSLTAPNANAQADLLIDAYENASVDPATVSFIEAHGTGTALGDPVEINGLKKAFNELYKRKGKPVPGKPTCGLGSVKTNIGHLEAAAGIAGLIKVILALKYRKIPGNVHFEKLNPYLQLENTPFYIVASSIPWKPGKDDENREIPLRAGISSFGFGGSNAHIVLEEYRAQSSPLMNREDKPQVIVLSAKNSKSLAICVQQMLHFLETIQPAAPVTPSPLLGLFPGIRAELIRTAAEILNVSTGEIDPTESLVDQGFDPQGLTLLAAPLEKLYGLKITAADFGGNTTIDSLAHSLAGNEPGPVTILSPGKHANTAPSLADIAYTLQQGREAMAERIAVIASTPGELWEKLNRYLQGETDIENLFQGNSSSEKTPGLSPQEKTKEAIIKGAVEQGDIIKIAGMFAAGMDIPWQRLYPHRHPCRISLPTYPFEKTTHWVKALPVPTQKSQKGGIQPLMKVPAGLERETNNAIPGTGTTPTPPGILLIKKDMKEGDNMANDQKTTYPQDGKVLLRDKTPSINTREMPGTPQVHFESSGVRPGIMHGQESHPAPRQEQVKTNEGSLKTTITRIKEILAAVLFIDISKVKEDGVFVEQGLDSILAVEFTRKLNDAFKIELNATKLYDYSTVNKLAAYISPLVGRTEKPAAPSPNPGFSSSFTGGKPLDLSYFQEKYYSPGPVAAPEPVTQSEPLPGSGGCEIAIIGMSAQFPRANNIDKYWENLANGVDAVTGVPPDRWDANKYYHPGPDAPDKTYCKWGGFLEDIDRFDPLFFNISPAEAEMLDPQQRLFLQEAWHAIEDAGYSAESLNNTRCGIYVGVISGSEYPSPSMFNAHSILAARLSYLLNLRGPAVAIDTACSSSLAAIHMACKSLLQGETDMMLAGGVTLYLTEKPFIGMSQMGGILSREGKCKTFDNSADGFVPGEGVGAVVLKLLDKAIADGDHIYGIIKGSGMNQDGKTNGITAPSAESQKDLELEVYKNSGVNPETVTYVEAHGTGTKLGDPIEIEALNSAFAKYTHKKQFCAIGSVKTNIGHTSAAAGLASVIKVLLAMAHQQIPPSLHFHHENEHINFKNSPFYVNTRLTEWKDPGSFPRRAAVSSFGYSGTNVHLVMEEYRASATRPQPGAQPSYFIPVSARTPEGLTKKFVDLLDWLNRKGNSYSPGEIGYTLARGRSHFAHRAVLVIKDNQQFKETLTRIVQGETPGNFFLGGPGKTSYPEATPGQTNEPWTGWIHLYTGRNDLDWNTLYPIGLYKRISLPTYPFLKERCWLPDSYFTQELPTPPAGTKGITKQNASPGALPQQVQVDETYILNRLHEDLGKFLQELLKVKASDLDITTNLIEYGFDSITFMEYVKRINQTYEINFAAENFFDLETPTLQSLSQYLYNSFQDRLFQHYIPTAQGITPIEPGHDRQHEVEELPGAENYRTPAKEPTAIIGISGIMPQSDDLEIFWKHLMAGKSLFTRIPGNRWQEGNTEPAAQEDKEKQEEKQGGFITEPGAFDAGFFGISPREAVFMDPQHRILLEMTWKAIEDAGYKAGDLSGTRTGVFVGLSFSSDYDELLKIALPKEKKRAWKKNTPSLAANRISLFFNLCGPSEAIDTAESSSLAALNRAVEALQNGSCSMAIVGGVKLILNPDQFDCPNSSGEIENTGTPNGAYIPGEGGGILLLKPLSQAQAENDHIYAVIKGTAENHSGGTDSLSSSLTDLFVETYKKSGVHPSGLSYIEIHGKAITPGKPSPEINAIKQAFALFNNENNPVTTPGKEELRCGLGSVKGNIGDLESAAGIAGLIKVLLAMKNKTLPGTLKPGNPDAGSAFESTPFYIVDQPIPWACPVDEKNESRPRRAGITSLGDSGTNVHVVLEEWHETTPQENQPQEQEAGPYLIILSAKNEEQLDAYAGEMMDFLENTAPAVQPPKNGEPCIDENNLRQKIGDDILLLSSRTLKTNPMGYEPTSIELFVQEINKTFNLEIIRDVFDEQRSVGTFIKFLIKNYKDKFRNHYNNSGPVQANHRGTPPLQPADIAYTLQVGRQEMEERLAFVISGMGELKEKLKAYCKGNKSIENVFRGTAYRDMAGARCLLEGGEKEEFIKIIIRNKNMAKLAYCWVSGVEIDWKWLYTEKTPKRISLPTYPFAKQQYWISTNLPPEGLAENQPTGKKLEKIKKTGHRR